ncbi:hypothetical protein RSOLAG1IB_08379 [Rhizoctonia solani AG-1 IB]|uniref:Uncharacterized protein n=1 Tax=Thanatephorus cucumeris (strain AG1-IB / isolate 7/3/14) TaxID=1108050 RepID=A0A0B7FLW2_THACB|nr:hypothetical protein RSOLAG1IB_08379 [Rhizoctonia solani AG-1 IB]
MANSARPPLLATNTHSRFDSEDRTGPARYYPAGSPRPTDPQGSEMHSEQGYFRQHQPGGQYFEEPQSYAVYEPEHEVLPPEPEPILVKPKKKNKIKQIFSRLKRKKKAKPERAVVVLDSPQRPLPQTPRTESDLQPPAPRFQAPPSEISSRRYELRDPGFTPLPRRMSITTSRDESFFFFFPFIFKRATCERGKPLHRHQAGELQTRTQEAVRPRRETRTEREKR